MLRGRWGEAAGQAAHEVIDRKKFGIQCKRSACGVAEIRTGESNRFACKAALRVNDGWGTIQ
jgi:succinate dehydrogenase/fumarate reductase-like Fe-S protein